LDQEAIALTGVSELVAKPGLGWPPPRLLVGAVGATDDARGMEAQIMADRRATDARAKQQGGRLERAAGHHHARRLHSHLGAAPVGRLPDGLDPACPAVLGEHLRGAGERQEPRAVLLSVREPGPVRALLAPGPVAEPEIPGALGRIAAGVGVANDRLEAPAERIGAFAQPLLGSVQVAAVRIGADPIHDRVEGTVEVVR